MCQQPKHGIGSTKCCNTCPFLTMNNDKPTPPGSELDWYTQANKDRIWEESRHDGGFLLCHSSDANAHQYGGLEGIKPGIERVCAGFALLAFMHIKVFERLGSYEKYRVTVGPEVAMSERALKEVAFGFLLRRTALKGGALVPNEINEPRELTPPAHFHRVRAAFDLCLNELFQP